MREGFFYPSLSLLGTSGGIFSHSEALQGRLSSNPQEEIETTNNIINNNLIFFIS